MARSASVDGLAQATAVEPSNMKIDNFSEFIGSLERSVARV
jgi:hypothetical protein